MGDIYRRASDVIVWLGIDDSHATFAIECIHDMYNANILTHRELLAAVQALNHADQTVPEHNSITRGKAGLDTLLRSFDFQVIAKVVEISLKRPWWHRI